MPELRRGLLERGGRRAAASIREWFEKKREQEGGEEIAAFILSHRHRVLHGLTVADVEMATVWPRMAGRRVSHLHALGNLEKEVVDKIADWKMPPWSTSFVLHDLLERMGRVPTWPEARSFLFGEARGRIVDEFVRYYTAQGVYADDRELLDNALLWRLGVAYYSWVREIDLLVRLRQVEGLPVRYHALADIELKCDMWCGNALIEIYIENERYRAEGAGRKASVDQKMNTTRFHRIEVVPKGEMVRGHPMLVPQWQIEETAARIKAANSSNSLGMRAELS
jgi:hypothetical protein